MTDAPQTASYVRALNGYYSRPDFFTTDLGLGTIRTPAGTRVCALTEDFLRGFRSALVFECGKSADRVFKRCGVRWGGTFAARFDREVGEHYGVPAADLSAGLVQACLDEAFRYHGWGTLAVDLAEYDSGFVQLTVRDSVMPAVVRQADMPADALMAGFLAGVFSHFAETELDCHQTDCPTRGADASRFVLGLAERLKSVPAWVAEKLGHAAVMGRLKRGSATG